MKSTIIKTDEALVCVVEVKNAKSKTILTSDKLIIKAEKINF